MSLLIIPNWICNYFRKSFRYVKGQACLLSLVLTLLNVAQQRLTINIVKAMYRIEIARWNVRRMKFEGYILLELQVTKSTI